MSPRIKVQSSSPPTLGPLLMEQRDSPVSSKSGDGGSSVFSSGGGLIFSIGGGGRVSSSVGDVGSASKNGGDSGGGDFVVHPIHDQTMFLCSEHKRKLKKEYGIEPWTFVQGLGDAVFIPAGCPHQVRNLKSCIKVALDFVSPENVGECIRMTEEFRLLPPNHRAKEDKLEVKKMTLYAIKEALKVLGQDIAPESKTEEPKLDKSKSAKSRKAKKSRK
ncbi:unnamed protein product [Cuscuta campestris]|uniref:JmjC domain-containing protein n=1 Tax=Cuscuta campestris TaxID=132261 RepID=A0A484KWK4_9ASTE|nr:unnamed protein product [Cuscuta campestris]